MKRKRKRLSRPLFWIALLVIGVSGGQYYQKGAVTWHWAVIDGVETYSRQILSLWEDSPGAGRATALEPIADSTAAKGAPGSEGELPGRVTEIVDGDTLVMRVSSGNEITVRLFGIDAPERNQPHGRESSRALTRLLNREPISVNVVDIDDYGRLVGTVYHDGLNVNLEMVRSGSAWWYEYYAGSSRELEAAEGHAREAGIGLWKTPDPVPPWMWRRMN